MMASNYDDSDDASYEERDKIDWSEYVKKQQIEEKPVELQASDYLALGIAAMQTIFLPLIVLAIVLIGFVFILGILT